MALNYADRIFWVRAGFGVLMGALSDLLFYSDYALALGFVVTMYVVTFYLVKVLWGGKMKPEDQRKLYTAGTGSYVLLFLFFWIFLFTLKVHLLLL